MANEAELAGLLERVRSATEGDRTLDCAIYDLFCPATLDDEWWWMTARGYTSSIDAAVAFVGKVLPGWSWEVRRSGFAAPAQAILHDPMKQPWPGYDTRVDHDSGCVPLALIAAAITALIAREATHV